MNDNNTLKTDELMTNPVDVDKLDESTEYVARLEFTSVGDSAEVRPVFKYTHTFADDYEGELPSSYLAMRDMAHVLHMMMHTEGTGLSPVTDEEPDFITIEDLEDLEQLQAGSPTRN